jgi:5'-3' exonuclease
MDDIVGFEENGVRLIFVFDGVDNPAKEDKCRGERTRERGKAEAALADSENAGSPSALWNLNAKTTEVDADVIANIMAWCDEREWATCISAWSEADAQLVRLQMDGHVDAIITNDSDVAVLGGTMILYEGNLTSDAPPALYERGHAVDDRINALSPEELVWLSVLCGNDYIHRLYGNTLRELGHRRQTRRSPGRGSRSI